MIAFVRTVRGQLGEDDNMIEPVVLIIFIHNLIVDNATAPAKSR